MPLIDCGDLEIHYQSIGEGRPLVMLHGLLVGSLAEWYFTAAPELARRHRVLLYDLRGHGRSARKLNGYRLADQVRDLEGLLAALDIEGPVSLVGHSYGALVALRYAMTRPDRVRRLAVVEAPLPPSSANETLGPLDPEGLERLLTALPEPIQAVIRSGGRRGRRFLESLRFLYEESSLMPDLNAEPDLPAGELAKLEVPLLCVYGSESRCRPAGERLSRVVPGAELVMLPGGHFLPLEQPQMLTRELGRFLDG